MGHLALALFVVANVLVNARTAQAVPVVPNFTQGSMTTHTETTQTINETINSVNYNTTKITNGGWHLNFKGAANQMETDSAIAKGSESDGTKNYQINLNGNKWINENLKFKSTFYEKWLIQIIFQFVNERKFRFE